MTSRQYLKSLATSRSGELKTQRNKNMICKILTAILMLLLLAMLVALVGAIGVLFQILRNKDL